MEWGVLQQFAYLDFLKSYSSLLESINYTYELPYLPVCVTTQFRDLFEQSVNFVILNIMTLIFAYYYDLDMCDNNHAIITGPSACVPESANDHDRNVEIGVVLAEVSDLWCLYVSKPYVSFFKSSIIALRSSASSLIFCVQFQSLILPPVAICFVEVQAPFFHLQFFIFHSRFALKFLMQC